jgi:hypothetical protein
VRNAGAPQWDEYLSAFKLVGCSLVVKFELTYKSIMDGEILVRRKKKYWIGGQLNIV